MFDFDLKDLAFLLIGFMQGILLGGLFRLKNQIKSLQYDFTALNACVKKSISLHMQCLIERDAIEKEKNIKMPDQKKSQAAKESWKRRKALKLELKGQKDQADTAS